MFFKRLTYVVAGVCIVVSLGGCSNAAVNSINKMSPLTSLASAEGASLSHSEREDIVFQKVTDRKLLDISKLSQVPQQDADSLSDYMNKVTKVLQGGSDTSFSDNLANYLQFEFNKTPYVWDRDAVNIIGVDTVSRRYVVDVKFKTTDALKSVIPASKICLGEPDYDLKMQLRYERYMEILNAKLATSSVGGFGIAPSAVVDVSGAKIAKFEETYGGVKSIIESQKEVSRIQRMRDDWTSGKVVGGKHLGYTYNGLIDSPYEKSSATMTVRFVILKNFTLGVPVGFTCEHLYLTDYNLGTDPTKGLTATNKTGADIVSKNINDVLFRFDRCVDEDNHIGLYSLISTYSAIDKYYADMFQYTYRKLLGFTTTLYSIDGGTMTVGVDRVRKVRGKGTSMQLPTYAEKYIYTMAVVGTKIKILDEVLISSKVIGEPVIQNGSDSTSIDSSLLGNTINKENKALVCTAVTSFGKLQVNQDTSSDKFRNVVDLSLSTSEILQLKVNMLGIKASKKVTWVESWMYSSSVYCQLRLKEVYTGLDGQSYDCESEVDLMKRDGKWQVIKYDTSLIVPVSTGSVDTATALSVVEKDK